MNFSSNSTAPPANRLSRLQITNGVTSQARTGLPLSATSFDYRNNNVSTNTNKIIHYSSSLGDKYTNSANNFSVKFSHSPRVPEIQMINKFYGLIPKKFVINERIKPPPTPVLRQKISTRPKTSKQSTSSPQRSTLFESRDGRRLRRHSSVDETGRIQQNDLDGNNGIQIPLLTKRISFERNPTKSSTRVDRSAGSDKSSSTGLSALLNQRVIRIDLNHMRWEEETAGDYEHDLLQPVAATEVENVPPKSGILRKTISFDESVIMNRHEMESTEDETGSGLCKGHLLQVNERPSTAQPSLVNFPVVRPNESGVSSWTEGKTTAERRSKLQRNFSIHPSFSSPAVDLWSTGESESCTYPDSMTRTGRRSFHVEPPPEVDTLVSKGSTKEVPKPVTRQQRSLEASPNTSGRKLTVAEKVQSPPPPSPVQPLHAHHKTVSPSAVIPAPILLPASERRKLFKKSVSLPAPEPDSNVTAKKAVGSGAARPTLNRQNSAAVTKSEVHRVSSNQSHNSKGKVAGGTRVTILKKTLIELKRLRPKTAPSNNRQGSSREKAGTDSGQQEEYPRRRRQPMKVKSDVSPAAAVLQQSESTPGVDQQTEIETTKKQVTIMESKSQKASQVKKPIRGGQSKVEAPAAAAVEQFPPRPPSPPPTAPTIPRRSFSLDEGSLLTYSSDAAQRADSMENSMQNSKKREECLKIYERMKDGGCAVRLQTIFRGLMTPSEYRMFMAAAEKAAAAAALVDAEATTADTNVALRGSDCPAAVEALDQHTGNAITVLAP